MPTMEKIEMCTPDAAAEIHRPMGKKRKNTIRSMMTTIAMTGMRTISIMMIPSFPI